MSPLPDRRAGRAAAEAPNDSGGGGIRSAFFTLLGVLVGVVGGYFATRIEAHSAAVDQGSGAAKAHLAVFELMQSDLDAMLQWQQKIAPAVSDRAWNVSSGDLEALGVVLRPTALARVEQATQQLNLVFPPGFEQANQSRAAHRAYVANRTDLHHADDIVRCAEIYLDQQVHPELHLAGSQVELNTCTAEFGINSPTRYPAHSVSIYLLKHKRSAGK